MQSWRLIVSEPDTGPNNMALDEALFTYSIESAIKCPVLRIYNWSLPCITIGYFQKYSQFMDYKLPITRRLTGGLLVKHFSDISYAFIASKSNWNCIYDQEKTYNMIHSSIKEGLSLSGIKSDFCMNSQLPHTKNNICTNTFYNYDLHKNNKKIVGSCQRRRGENILQQGSIHLDVKYDFKDIAYKIAKGFENVLNIKLHHSCPNSTELSNRIFFSQNKYNCDEWNMKF